MRIILGITSSMSRPRRVRRFSILQQLRHIGNIPKPLYDLRGHGERCAP
jgi:hypothetical protein